MAKGEITGNHDRVKRFYKSKDQIPKVVFDDKKQLEQAISNTEDAIRELIGSTLYKLLLPDHSPKESSVATEQDYLYVSSELPVSAPTLSEFSGNASGLFISFTPKLQKLENFEKVIAA